MEMHQELKERFRRQASPLECIPTGESPVLKRLSGIRAVVFDVYGTLIISGVGDIGVDDGVIAPERILDALEQSGVQWMAEGAGEAGEGVEAGEALDVNEAGQALDVNEAGEAGTINSSGTGDSGGTGGTSTNIIHAQKVLDLYNETVNELRREAIAKGIHTPEPDIRNVWSRVLESLKDQKLIQFDSRFDGLLRTAETLSLEFEIRMNPTWPMPNMTHVLDRLHAKSYDLGIISNSQFYTPIMIEAYADRTLRDLGFSSGLLHWSYEVGLKKPSITFYRRFLEKMVRHHPTLQPEEILYVGNDMRKDILPAQTLGFKTALFAGDQRSLRWRRDDPTCKTLEPDLVVTDLMQIAECLSA